jgi:RNA polymerase sigma-70 factor (ECF subfamily)
MARSDPEALREAWERYADAVRSALCVSLGSDPVVEDLTQEVFLSIYRRAGQLRDPAALRPYLLASAVRLAAFERRTRGRRHRWLRLLESEPAAQHSCHPNVEERDALRTLRRLLDALSERSRVAFVLRYVEDLSPAQVAVALGVSDATAKRAIARARNRVTRLAAREPALAGYMPRTDGGQP